MSDQPQPDPQPEIPVRFTDMAYGGDAVGRDPESGLAVFAWPGIAGEQASVRVTQRRTNMLRGVVTEVQEASAARTEPSCPYFGPCGGCQWQHINYEGQVGFKDSILRSQLVRSAGLTELDGIVHQPLTSPKAFNYRNTSHFAVALPERKLGYFTRDSHHIIAVDQCPISNAGINQTIPLVNAMLAEAPEEDILNAGARGIMRVWQVTIRSSEVTGHTVVVFHSRAEGRSKPRPGRRTRSGHAPSRPDAGPSAQPDPTTNPDVPLVRREVRRAMSRIFKPAEGESPRAITAVEVMEDGTINTLGATNAAATISADAAADALSGSFLRRQKDSPESTELGPPLGSWVERLGQHTYWVAPEAFFQANTEAAELMLTEVLANVPEAPGIVVDAHAGVGTFGLALAGRAERVICFEPHSGALHSGRWSAVTAQVRNMEFRQGRAEQLMQRLTTGEQPGLVVLDPPRAGCQPELLTEIARRRVPRLIYVSCDPSTLARDIKLLAAAYRLSSARTIDMFPQTFHIETVAVLDLL